MNEVVFKTLKEKDFIIKNYLIKVATELKLSLNDTLLLVYLMNQDIPALNIENIASTMYLTTNEIMESYTKLKSLGLITVEIKKNKQGQIDEIISLDNIIKSVTVEKTKTQKKVEETNLFELFEKEFGRPLSPMEFEIINNWEKDGYDESLIKEALKEAIYNNAKTFRYVNAILQAWKQKGYKTSKDINKELKKESEDTSYKEIFDYDWVNED